MDFGSFRVVNLFAFRATNPRALRAAADPVGPGNDAALMDSMVWADKILCGWGGHGGLGARDRVVTALLRQAGKPLWHLGLTQAGQPKHPLYIGYAVQPLVWENPTSAPP